MCSFSNNDTKAEILGDRNTTQILVAKPAASTRLPTLSVRSTPAITASSGANVNVRVIKVLIESAAGT